MGLLTTEDLSLTPDPEQFTREWVSAWNAHDLGQILSHYADDFEMSSPYIAQIAGEPSGTLKGKVKVAEYWKKALERMPDLHFRPILTLQGAGCLAIHYEGALGRKVVEVFFFTADGRIQRACALYA